MHHSAEHQRLKSHRAHEANWRNWGPYLAERAWGTVREDYSDDGDAWGYFPHDHARSRAYRWGEDGLSGICDRYGHINFAVALWNGADPILKERMFGLTGPEGNHAEDVKEYYFYLDNTPTHSYMKMLYKYPQAAFPYVELLEENAKRGYHEFEYELLDTNVFDEDRYFDVNVEYAKADQNDLLIQITATNRGPDAAPLHILPTLWFRNTWSWGYENGPMQEVPGKPNLWIADQSTAIPTVALEHPAAGSYWLYASPNIVSTGDTSDAAFEDLLFTENETNFQRLFGGNNSSAYVKDAFHRYVVDGEREAVNPAQKGTKTAAHYRAMIGSGERVTVRLRLADRAQVEPLGNNYDAVFGQRMTEADEFYSVIQPEQLDDDLRSIQRQAYAGMLWTKQLFYYDVQQWLRGDPKGAWSSRQRKRGRNSDWGHLVNFDVLSMPDKWEYPWFATWDTAFHCIPLAEIDPDYAKRQLELFTREWYMHPNGQLPAYEWNFSDVNPPVHAWAVWQVYEIDKELTGEYDRPWLEGIFHKLLLNFTWWVNRKDADDNNIFQGGFLGLDNISVFDRSQELPGGGHVDQSDATAWMGAYSLTMVRIALELAKKEPVYQDSATKFFEHFLRIATATTSRKDDQHVMLWDEEDGFFYDVLHLPDDRVIPLRVRSLVGLLPIFAVESITQDALDSMTVFNRRMNWFIKNRPGLSGNIADVSELGQNDRHLTAFLDKSRLRQVLRYMLDEDEFLSPHGIRSLSKIHEKHPFVLNFDGETRSVHYEPAESQTGIYGGNSNWRGPVWFPINFLIIESLRKFHQYYGEEFRVECPTGSGNMATLEQVADDLSRRLISLFVTDGKGNRPIYGGLDIFQNDSHWREHLLFYEYFHGDNGAGLGASHQTGWTGLVATLIQQQAKRSADN